MEISAGTQEKIDKLLKLPQSARMGILAGIGALICTGYYFGFYQDCSQELDRLRGEPVAQDHVGAALLAIAFQWIARHGCTQEQKVIEIRQAALGAKAPYFVDSLVGRPMNFGEHLQGECCRWTKWILLVHISSANGCVVCMVDSV